MRVTIQFTIETQHAQLLERVSAYENKTISGYVRELVIAHLSKVKLDRSVLRSIEQEDRTHG